MNLEMYNYTMASKNTHQVQIITDSLDKTITDYASCVDDEEFNTVEDYKSMVLDLLVECRKCHTQLDIVIDQLKEADNQLLNMHTKNGDKIRPHSDNEFKKKFISIR
jgi:hypothetical protein